MLNLHHDARLLTHGRRQCTFACCGTFCSHDIVYPMLAKIYTSIKLGYAAAHRCRNSTIYLYKLTAALPESQSNSYREFCASAIMLEFAGPTDSPSWHVIRRVSPSACVGNAIRPVLRFGQELLRQTRPHDRRLFLVIPHAAMWLHQPISRTRSTSSVPGVDC